MAREICEISLRTDFLLINACLLLVLQAIDGKIHAMRITLARVMLLIATTFNLDITAAPVGLNLFAEGFTSPTVLVPLPDGSGRLLIADQIGTVHVVSKQGKVQPQLFLDLRDRLTKLNNGFDERGILGL